MKKAVTNTLIVWTFLAVIFSLGCSKQKGANEWQTFTSQQGGFSLLFPGTPTNETKYIKPFQTHTIAYKPDETTTYGVVYIDVPSHPDPRGPDKIFDDTRQAALGKNGKPLHEIPITLDGYSGRELEWQTFYTDKKYGVAFTVAHLFVTKKHFYMVMAVMPSSERFSTNYWRFLNSFQLLDAK
jgi:hypothetical protein